jgi:hypothetical protein
MDDEGAECTAGLAPFHMIPGGHEQVGRPFHLLTQTIQYWSGRFGNTLVGVTFARRARECTEPVMTVGKPPRHDPGMFEGVQDSKETWFGNVRCAVDVVQRSDRRRLQHLHHLQASLQTLDHFRLLRSRLRPSLHPATLPFRPAEFNIPVSGMALFFPGSFG